MNSPLDNATWQALSTRQSHFNRGNEVVKYFPEEVAPFLALEHWDEKEKKAMLECMPAGREFFVLIARPVSLPEEVEIIRTVPVIQMVCEKLIPGTPRDIQTQPLTPEHVPQMIELTRLTRPGPFTERTIEFGNYFGVFEDGKLVAMTGERLKVNGYTEVSAICTHPAHLGKGYASHLLTQAARRIFDSGHMPFLHVLADNTGAVELYRKKGFYTRADVYFAIFRKR